MDKIQKQIWEVIQEMNRKWTVENKVDELKNYFHEKMVAITPTDLNRIEGGENCVDGWKKFAENTKLHFWKEFDPKVQVYGDGKFAIVTYYFDMSFDMANQTINMKGRDMFALINENEKWFIVADQFSQIPNL
ncbi:MAG: nuclear transport factor 2 family protein [Ignavibacteria bacterium]|nr:nuclear transport factor 2 family protein [Ignavibacteria bacterium]